MKNPVMLILGAGLAGIALFYSRKAAAMFNPEESTPEPESPSSGDIAEPSYYPSSLDATRGERNNNPGNIKKGANWVGLAPSGSEKTFAVFDSPVYGIRAMTVTLHTYYTTYGLRTVRQIISRWAPIEDNGASVTAAYIRAVSDELGVSPDTVLTYNTATINALVKAIIRHENGRVAYDDYIIATGVALA